MSDEVVVTQSITRRWDDVLPIESLANAKSWTIVRHQVETRDDVAIETVDPNVQSPFVCLQVEWTDCNNVVKSGLFTERDIQYKDENVLLRYWNSRKGKRSRASGLDPDHVHLLRILGEKLQGKQLENCLKLKVQFVGYSKREAAWWGADVVKKTYVELYDDWMQNHSKIGK